MSILLQSLHAELGKLKDSGLAASLYAQGWETWSAPQATAAEYCVNGITATGPNWAEIIGKRDASSIAACSAPDYGLSWGDPISTVSGPRVFASREAQLPANHPFWTLWRSKGRELQAQGFSVAQRRGVWWVNQSLGSTAAPTAPSQVTQPYEILPLINSAPLYPWQIRSTQETIAAVKHCGACLNASGLGAGKTIVTLVACREMGVVPTVICPKIVKPAWKRAAEMVGVKIHCVENYEKVRTGKTLLGCWETPAKKTYRWDISVKFLVFDEAARGGAHNSQNSALLIAAKRQSIPTILLSATLASTPLRMKAAGYILGLHPLVGWGKWIEKYGCGLDRQFGGYKFFGDEQTKIYHVQRLHSEIFPYKGTRIRTADVPEFPETQITTDYVDVPNYREISAAYESVEKALLDVRQKQMNDVELPITKLLRARQVAELGKVPAFIELTKDALDEGLSVVLFVNFTATLRSISEELNKQGVRVSEIHGGQTGVHGEQDRDDAIGKFLADINHVTLVNVEAGKEGVRLNDIHGKRARVAYISPPWSETTLRQVTGRIVGANSKSKSTQHILVAAGTAEERVEKLLAAKSARLDAFNDGNKI